MAKSVKRLYEQFQPSNYRLELDIDVSKLEFSGRVVLTGKKVGRPSQRVTLHQKDLQITKASIEHTDKKSSELVEVDRINTHDTYHEVRLHTKKILYPGEYKLTLEFKGKITDPMHGIYPCYYQKDGKKQHLIATQFESHHAREAFPCIDEPEAKATYDLTIISPEDLTVLSNTPIKKQLKTQDSRLKTHFETTPIMSSYLLAFAVGDIHCVEGKSKNGIEMRTWAHTAQPKKFLEYANNEAVKVIDFFEDYFKTPFPLKKCDQIALPDFEAGAMENWGLITYREVALLADPDNRSVSSEQYISMVIAHEVSHQWFGNLVTMKWWDDLWLNESFASLMEHVALNALHSDWRQWEHYASVDIIACSNRDIYKDVQSVRVEVNHPDEIHTIFDGAIVYAKGGRLLKMLMDYIGEDTFRVGLQAYFKKHKFQNTIRDDLWRALGEASKVDVKKFMEPWIEQSGMPLVKVDATGKDITLEQERFVLDAKNDPSLWPIPLLADQKVEPEIFESKSVTAKSSDTTTVLNSKGSGHFVVAYQNKAQQKNLITAISQQKIPAEARINVLNDMLLLARRGDKSLVDALEVIKQLSGEPRDAVWAIIARVLGLAMLLVEGDKVLEAKLRELKAQLGSHWHKKLGWEIDHSEDSNTILLRTTAIGLMVGGEDSKAIKHCLSLYNSLDLEKLPAEYRGIILGAAVRHGGSAKIIDSLVNTYKTTHNPDLQLSICAALTHTRDPKVADKLIKEGFGASGFVRPQDHSRWFAYFMRNQHTREQTWQWLTGNWDWIMKMFNNTNFFDAWVIYSAAPLHTRAWQKRFYEFFEPKQDIIGIQKNIKIAFSEIEARVAWHDRDLPLLKKYFN